MQMLCRYEKNAKMVMLNFYSNLDGKLKCTNTWYAR